MNANMKSGSRYWMIVLPFTAVLVAGSVWTVRSLFRLSSHSHKGQAYTAEGYGGYVPLTPAPAQTSMNDPLASLHTLYRAGQWTQVEAQAGVLWEQGRFSSDNAQRKQAAQAELLAGYAAAWRKDYRTAGERFRATQMLAGELPDHGAPPKKLGEPQATLEEEASFQHAVCVGAEGRKPQAETEYDDFMRQYPHSILIHAAIKRITRLHGGNIPASAETLWKRAMQQQKTLAERQEREQALCGPKCLAELLRRQGKPADIHRLANEMHTGTDGSSLQNLALSARKHGFAPKGLALTPAGLAKQPLPLIALLKPGHYVLVQALTREAVTVWDPETNKLGQGVVTTYPAAQWQQEWTGLGLTLR